MRSSSGTVSARLILLAALLALPGCVTTADREEAQLRLRKANSRFDIAIDHMVNDRISAAVREFRVAASLDPQSPRIHAGLAEAYLRKGRVEEAETHLVRAIEIDPEYHDARLNLSALYLLLGRNQEASAQAQILVDDPTFPGVWRAYTNRAVAEMGLGNRVVAREQLELALDFHPTYWPALLSLGILESEDGRVVESIGYFERMLDQRASPNAQSEANYRLAEIYVSLGKRRKAVAHLETAVAQMPEGTWGKKSETYLKILR